MLVYITLGGLTSAIYNEVLQFFIIVAALLPLTIVALHDMGGVDGLQDRVKAVQARRAAGCTPGRGWASATSTNPLDANWIGIVFGLGFVLSFGYWTTNFAEVQRALSAKNLSAARRTPLIGAYPKIFIPALTIIPGLVALVTVKGLGGSNPNLQYNNAIPHPDRALPARGHARHRGDRPAGGVHGRRRRERHLVQHGRHVRPVAVLRRARIATPQYYLRVGRSRRSAGS